MGSKTFAIGDIHGCARELKELLDKLPLDKDSKVVFLGDYVDRGPDSRGVIDTIIDLQKKCDVISLFGNHEAMFLEFISDPSSMLAGFFILNGGSATLASYVTEGNVYKIPEDHLQFLRNLQLYHETDTHFFVHAGVPNIKLKKLEPMEYKNEMIWMRHKFLKSDFQWEKIIVHGHTPTQQVEIKTNRINLDTGCVFSGQLTAMEVNSGEIYTVSARENIPVTFLKADPLVPRIAARFAGSIPVHIEIDGNVHEFETLNYNEFGLLILESATSAPERTLQVGQILKGSIGDNPENSIGFTGQVVRHQKRDDQIAYGVKMLEPLKTQNNF